MHCPRKLKHLNRLQLTADQVASHIEVHIKQQKTSHLSRLCDHLRSVQGVPFSGDLVQEQCHRLTSLLSFLADEFGLRYAAVYSLVDSGIKGVASYNLTHHDVSQVYIPVDQQHHALEGLISAHRQDRVVGCPLPAAFPLSASLADTHQVKTASVIPIHFSGQQIGLLAVAPDPARRLELRIEEDFLQHEFIIADMLRSLQIAPQLVTSTEKHSAYDSLVYGIAQLSDSVIDREVLAKFVLRHDRAFKALLRDVATLFEASLVSLFLPDEPVGLNKQRRIPQFREGTRFTEVAKFKRIISDEAAKTEIVMTDSAISTGREIKFVTASRHGLTASILQTMQPQISQNVPDDPMWSRLLIEFDEGSPRTWMGVPLLCQHEGHWLCYGVITVTRHRESVYDRRAFRDLDILALRNVAELMCSVFFSRDAVSGSRGFLQSVLRRFNHDLPNVMDDISNGVSKHLESIGKRNRHARRTADQILWKLDGLKACLRSLLTIYIDDNPQSGDRRNPVNFHRVEESVRALLQTVSVASGVELTFSYSDDVNTPCVDEEMLIYTVFIVVHNAMVSCFERRAIECRHTGRVGVRFKKAIRGAFGIEVKDNGIGRRRGDKEAEFGGQLMWPSQQGNGVGLEIAKVLIKHMGGGDDGVRLLRNANGAVARFILSE